MLDAALAPAQERDLQIGGDFFDVWRLAANDWAFVVGDACGKGPHAASVAALARWSVRASAVHHFQPSKVVHELNDVLLGAGDADDHFCTVAFGRVELERPAAHERLIEHRLGARAGRPLARCGRSRRGRIGGQLPCRGTSMRRVECRPRTLYGAPFARDFTEHGEPRPYILAALVVMCGSCDKTVREALGTLEVRRMELLDREREYAGVGADLVARQ